MRKDPVFGFETPEALPGVDPRILEPRTTWADPAAYDAQAAKLAEMFVENFKTYEAYVDDAVKAAAPKAG